MANTLRNFLQTWQGEYLKVFLICTLVAMLINLLEGNSSYAWLTFFCSYCYGLCTHTCISLARKWFPAGTRLTSFLLPSIMGFIIGTIIILVVSSQFVTGYASDLMGWLLIALVAHCVTMYWLFSLERDTQLKTKLKVMELEKIEKEKALIQSQLCLLQSQIEPHFLFNTFANLKASIQLDPKRAMAMLDHLTVLLRQSLKRSQDQQLSLNDEIHFCESYLAVQQMRLGSRLKVNIDVDDSVNLQQAFPPLLIQPLVENAILHGIESQVKPCSLTLRITLASNQQLRIEVQDDGAGLGNSEHKGHGIGLDNIRQRLQHYYSGGAKLMIVSNQSGGTTSVLSLPFSGEQKFSQATQGRA